VHDILAVRALEEAKEQTRLLKAILKVLLHEALYGTIGASMNPLIPGSTHTFTVTVTPADATIVASESVWTSSDTTNAPVTEVDETGLVATVAISSTATVGTPFTLSWSYTNSDGSVASATLVETVVAPVIDVTGGVITETT